MGGGSHEHLLVPVLKMQVWLVSGQGPSQIGAIDCSHTIGSQTHSLRPELSGTQAVSGGHSPSQVGNGDCSQAMLGGSHRHSSRLCTKMQA
jgi:hypothetical protein